MLRNVFGPEREEVVGTRCRVEMTTQQSNNNLIYFHCSVVQ